MKKHLLLIFATIFYTGLVFGQDVYFTKAGTVIFDSSTPLETIYAENNQVTSFLKTTDGELNFAALIKSFRFKNALMEEHFNENFIESSTFPKAVFKGKISNWSAIDLSKEEDQQADIEGELTLHGVTKKISTKANLHPQKDKIFGTCKFVVSAEDFGIKIPSLVREKIAKEVNVTVAISYEPYKK